MPVADTRRPGRPPRLAVFTRNYSNPAYEAAWLGAERAATAGAAKCCTSVPEREDDPEQQVRQVR